MSEELKAVEAVEAIFSDLRGRSLLKWLFDRRGEENLIGRFDDGEELRGICLEAQDEIKASWIAIINQAIDANGSEIKVMKAALEHAQSVIAMMIEPDSITTTSTAQAFAACKEADIRIRAALKGDAQ